MKVKNSEEACSNCEYVISPEMREEISRENSEYSEMSCEELEQAIGTCEFGFETEKRSENIYWCEEYTPSNSYVKQKIKKYKQ